MMRSVKLRLLGLLAVAVLGVLGFASSASAVTELESGFYIKEALVGSLKASVEGKQIGRGTLFVPSLKIEINCEKFKIISGFISSTNDAEASLLYEECTTLTNNGVTLEEVPGCEFVTNHEGGAQKEHITATALFLPAELKNGNAAVLAENIVAKVLTKSEVGCLLPKTTTIKGELCLKVEKNHKVEPELSASQAIQGECKARLSLNGAEVAGTAVEIEKLESEGKAVLDKLLFGTNEAFAAGKATVALAVFPHKGLTLGVLLL